MRCVFVGTVEFSKAMLAVLLQAEADVALVIVRKNQAAHSDFADLKPLCRQHQVPLWETDDINSVDTVEKIQQVAPDVGFCFGWKSASKRRINKTSFRL